MRRFTSPVHVSADLIQHGPLIEVKIGPSQQEIDAAIAAGEQPKQAIARLLVDTGAQSTCVENTIPAGWGLAPIRFIPFVGVSGKPEEYPVYRMTIGFEMIEEGNNAVHDMVFSADIVGTPSPSVPWSHAGLLGRDFMSYVRVIYDGPLCAFEFEDYRHVSAPATPRPGFRPPLKKKKKRR